MPRNGTGGMEVTGADLTNGTLADATAVQAKFDDIETALTASIAKDGQTTPTASLPMGGFNHTNVGVATARTHYARASQIADGALTYGGVAGGTADALTLSPSPAITAYVIGQQFQFKVGSSANTGAATLNVNSVGAGNITWPDGTALAAGDLPANAMVLVEVQATTPVFHLQTQTRAPAAFLNINGLTAETAPATGDFVALYDLSATGNRKMTLANLFTLAVPVGAMIDWPTGTAPSGWLACDGSAVSRTTYASLFAALVTTPGFSGQTFTVTIASPGVVTKTGHGFTGGERLRLSTTGALPTGLDTTSDFFVIYVDANTFRLATSEANAAAGTAINTSGSQSGTHTYTQSLYGLGDGSTTFNLPDFRDVYVRGTPASGATIGTYRKDAMQGHQHNTQMDGAQAHGLQTRNSLGADEGVAKVNNGAGAASNSLYVRDPVTDGTNGTPRTASETRPVTRYASKIIKF